MELKDIRESSEKITRKIEGQENDSNTKRIET